MMGLYWAGYYTMLGMYGLKFSVWIVVIFLGALLLGAGAFMQWALPRKWTLSLLIAGSSTMAAYWEILSFRYLLNDLPDYIFLCILIICVGGILSGTGEMLKWAVPRRWQQLVPLVGSLTMASFFVTATLGNLTRFIAAFDSLPSSSTLAAMITDILVVTSLAVALKRNVSSLRKKGVQ